MDCPKCPGKLEAHTIEGLDIDTCFVCEGLWFDAGELEEVIKRDSKDFDYIDVGQEEYDGEEVRKTGVNLDKKAGKCPICKAMMTRTPYAKKHSVTVDVCPKGHGVWLDGGEIKQLRHRGLVKLHDHLAYYKEMFSVLFSKEGFQDVFRKGRRVLEDRMEGKDPKRDPEL
jgi:Zn-finger nucleic acid-binding protein